MTRVSVHVNPGAKRSWVGGSYDGAVGVHVRARAREGAATNEVLEALAKAFGVKNADVVLVHGARSRSKLVQVHGDPDAIGVRLTQLLRAPKD